MGVKGAALGTLIAYGITFVFMQIYLHKILKINPLKPFLYMIEFYAKIMGVALKLLSGNRKRANALDVLDHKT